MGITESEPRPMSVADALDRAASYAREGRLSVLCGAGISVPGGLPRVAELVSAILDWTLLSDVEKGWISSIVPHRLPFERMMELVLGTMTDGARQQLIGMFRLGSPGPSHKFLSVACAKGLLKTICTTNFDRHLETALNDAGLKPDEQYVVYQDLAGLRAIDWSADRIRVLKLHGSVDHPAEMAVTVSKVADQTAAGTLSSIIERVFGGGEDQAVLALGYSFSDRFDLSPAIEQVGKGEHRSWILNIDHAGGVRDEKAELTEYRNVVHDPKSFYLPSPLLQNPTALRLSADTAWVVQELGRRLEIEVPEQEKINEEWSAYLKKFAVDLNATSYGMLPDALTGSLLTMIGMNAAATPFLKSTIEEAKKSGNEQAQLAAAQMLIESYSGANNYGEAWHLLNETEPLARSMENGKHADYVLSQFGSLYKQVAEKCVDLSRRYFQKAIDISIQDGVVGLRTAPHVAGVAAAWMRMGDMDAARLRYKQARDIAKRYEEPTLEAGFCGDLAGLEYIVRHYKRALNWYNKAIALSHLAGDRRNEGIHLINKAKLLEKQKLHPAALACQESARELLEQRDQQVTANTVRGIQELGRGHAYLRQSADNIEACLAAEHLEEAWHLLAGTEPLVSSIENDKDADHLLSQFGSLYQQLAGKCIGLSRRYFQEAVDFSKKDGVASLRPAPHLAGVAAAWMRLGDMDAARQCYKEAYGFVKLGADPTREAEVCGNLASLEYIVQDYKKAFEWYDKAISLSHLAGDQRNEAIHLMNKANVFVKKKLYQAALDCYEAARDLLAKEDTLLSLLDYHEAAAIRRRDENIS